MRFRVALVLAICIGFSGLLTAQTVASQFLNGIEIADNFPGGDIGARINAAVAACPNVFCTVQVNASGTISTCPDLPPGFTLSFNPSGYYELSCHWILQHRGITLLGNGANFTYTLGDGGTAIYIGKEILSTVNVSGSTISWKRGSQFAQIDRGDQVAWYANGTLYMANVASATSTAITLTASQTTQTSVPMISFMENTTTLAKTSQGPTIKNLTIADRSGTAADNALVIELADVVNIDHFTATSFLRDTCLTLLGALSGNFYALNCASDGNGIFLGNNALGGFVITASNANRWFGGDLQGGTLPTGTVINVAAGSGNEWFGLRLEGNVDQYTIVDASGGNFWHFDDYERNGNADAGVGTYEINLQGSSDTIQGPSQVQSSSESILSVSSGVSGTILEDLGFKAQAPGATAYRFFGTAQGQIRDVSALAGLAVSNGSLILDPSGNITAPTLRYTSGNNAAAQSTATQTAGQLACIKSVGPPVEIGTCMAVSGATCTRCN